eukprot:scaffold114372_cov66-Phaeocystis_antarctica.AAC.1
MAPPGAVKSVWSPLEIPPRRRSLGESDASPARSTVPRVPLALSSRRSTRNASLRRARTPRALPLPSKLQRALRPTLTKPAVGHLRPMELLHRSRVASLVPRERHSQVRQRAT